MRTDKIEAAAMQIREAYTAGAIPPLRDFVRPTDERTAYAIQQANTQYWVREGRRIVGHKVGLTADAVQKQLGVDSPDFGILFDDMRIDDEGKLAASKVIQPKVEAEIALVLGKDLVGPETSADDVRKAVDYAVGAIEVVDSRIKDWKITFADTVADNGSSSHFVVGRHRRSLADLDLRVCGMVLEVNNQIRSLGTGAACLGNPLNAAAWLARTMAKAGELLRAGDIILTGALGPMVALSLGDKVTATIGGFGAVSLTYEA